jgi:hypothetical protein
MQTWIDWWQSWFGMTYWQFMHHLRNESIPIGYRQDFFYNHSPQFHDELQKNKADLHYVSTMLCES